MSENKEHEVHKIISPTDGTTILYDIDNRRVLSFEFRKEDASNATNPRGNDTKENPDKPSGTEYSGNEEVQEPSEEARNKDADEKRTSEQNAEDISESVDENDNFLSNW